MNMIARSILVLTAVAAAVFAAGCPERKNIADIEAHPGKYQDKRVAVAGVVRDSYGISIPGTAFGGGAYKIDDGTGSIWVLVTDGSVPAKGTEIAVEGVIANGINWKGRPYGLGMYERKRHYRKR